MDPRITARPRQICVRCIMDTSDPDIVFDDEGICNHCHYFDNVIKPHWLPNAEGAKRLDAIVEQIKREEAGKEYDCILGLSGGVDSSYLAYVAKQRGLRPLVVHIDTGWNSELAVKNIEEIVKKLGFDLFTHVVDWDDMRDLQLAFFKSGVANQDVPQDHAIFAALYKFAIDNHIRYVLSGSNYATECILPASWGYSAMDAWHIKAIHKAYGQRPLRHFPLVGFFKYHFYFPKIRGMQVIKPLNLMPYTKAEAIQTLTNQLGWRYYGGKHYESRFTKFFQGYYLPTRFGYDKRRAHLSSLVVTGQLTREQAALQMYEPAYAEADIAEDRRYICKKLGISEEQWEREIMQAPLRSYRDFRSQEQALKRLNMLRSFSRKLRGR